MSCASLPCSTHACLDALRAAPLLQAELPMALARALLSDAVHVSEAAAMAALAAGDDDDHADAAEVRCWLACWGRVC